MGKTYILKAFADREFQNLHYINFEEDDRLEKIFTGSLQPDRILNELQFYLNHHIDADEDVLIFDEIQRCPRALTSLKYFCEEKPELALCAAGSLLGLQLNRESFPVGKVTFLDLHPMTFHEFIKAAGRNRLSEFLSNHHLTDPVPEMAHDALWEQWKLYLAVGGLPEAVKTYCNRQDNPFDALQAVRKVQLDLFDTYLADMAKHCGKLNALHVERLWKNVPVQLAKAQDGSAPKFRFRDAIPGIRGYEQLSGPLHWLERAELILRTYIVDKPERPLAGYAGENRFKLYFMDVGLMGAISNIPPDVFLKYDFGSYQGYIAENYTAQAFRAAGIRNLYAWQGRTSEVEFLLESPEGIVPVEVKSGRITRSKSLSVFMDRYSPNKAFILSARNTAIRNDRLCLPLYLAGPLAGAWRNPPS